MNYTYVVRCNDGTLYTGWTNDLNKRLQAHNSGKGAKYTKPRLPVELVYVKEHATKEEAMQDEYRIKQLPRRQKLELCDHYREAKKGNSIMSLQKAEAYLEKKGFLDHVITLEESTATVTLAAQALGVQPGMIAKTMSFLQGEQVVLILTEGTAKIDNRKYKDTFHVKAKMIPFEEVEEKVGHAPGGVCPFGVKEGVVVYLDESLKKYEVVYPAAGDDHSAVKLTIPELEEAAEAQGWIDVCKEEEQVEPSKGN